MKLDAGIAGGDDDAAIISNVVACTIIPCSRLGVDLLVSPRLRVLADRKRARDCVQRTFFTPPRYAYDCVAAGPGKHGDADRMVGLREAESDSQLSSSGRPNQGSHLGLTIDGGKPRARAGVKEVDASIIATASGSNKVQLPWREGDGFDGSIEQKLLLVTVRDCISNLSQSICATFLAMCNFWT